MEPIITEIYPVDHDPAPSRLIETTVEVDEGALPRPTRTNERDDLTCTHLEINATKDWLACHILEVDSFEPDRLPPTHELEGTWPVSDLDRGIEELEDSLRTDQTWLDEGGETDRKSVG